MAQKQISNVLELKETFEKAREIEAQITLIEDEIKFLFSEEENVKKRAVKKMQAVMKLNEQYSELTVKRQNLLEAVLKEATKKAKK